MERDLGIGLMILGDQLKICPKCKGKGTHKVIDIMGGLCYQCNGESNMKKISGIDETCSVCEGSGYFTMNHECEYCKGYGHRTWTDEILRPLI
jgi:RecJ-like exonuclease